MPNKPVHLFLLGNCQTMNWAELLKLAIPELQVTQRFALMEELDDEIVSALDTCDVFMYQPVENHMNPALNTDALLALLNPKAVQIRIQNMYFALYFGVNSESRVRHEGKHMFTSNLMERHIATGTYGEHCLEVGNLDGTQIVESWYYEEILRNKRRRFDVEITDWIRDNFRHKKLFYTVNHAAHNVYLRLMVLALAWLEDKMRLLTMHGLSLAQVTDRMQPYLGEPFCGVEIPIMPEIAQALQLEFDADRAGYWADPKVYSRREYLEKLENIQHLNRTGSSGV